jgi:hypothetical protein
VRPGCYGAGTIVVVRLMHMLHCALHSVCSWNLLLRLEADQASAPRRQSAAQVWLVALQNRVGSELVHKTQGGVA